MLPGLAVARELRRRGHEVLFIGTRRGLEAKLVPAEGFPIEWIEISGMNRVGVRKAVESLAALPRSVFRARAVLKQFQASAIFSLGGYVAGPVLLAAIQRRTPIVAMEPNAVPGFTHRQLRAFIARALVSFEDTGRWFRNGRTEVTGMPIREEFFAIRPKPRGAVLTVLITGGSQGSAVLNRAVEESWALWAESGLQVKLLHQTGARAFQDIEAKYASFQGPGLQSAALQGPAFQAPGAEVEIAPFFRNMRRAFEEADIIVSRAGMGTVSEIAAAGKPSILVPLATASDDHQTKNAQALERIGAARLVKDAEMSGRRLVDEVKALALDAGRLEAMGAAAKRFAKPGAAAHAADVLESLGEGRR